MVGIEIVGDVTEEEILRRAAAINSHSDHPLANAIVEAARARGISIPVANDFQSVSGRGARALIDGHPHFIGNHRMTHDTGICSPEIEARLAAIEEKGPIARRVRSCAS